MKIINSKYSSKELREAYEKAENKVESDLIEKIDARRSILLCLFGIALMVTAAIFFAFDIGICTKEMTFTSVLMFSVGLLITFPGSVLFGPLDEEGRTIKKLEKQGHIFTNPLANIFTTNNGGVLLRADGSGVILDFADLLEFCEKVAEMDVEILRYEDELIVLEKDGNGKTRVVDIFYMWEWMYDIVKDDTLDFSIFDKKIEEGLKAANITA